MCDLSCTEFRSYRIFSYFCRYRNRNNDGRDVEISVLERIAVGGGIAVIGEFAVIGGIAVLERIAVVGEIAVS
jgi:hypothetical protein